MSDSSIDVVVIGGGAAGLSGALTLARARRSVVVLDDGAPRNRYARGVHGFLSCDRTPPAELPAASRAEVRRYGGRILDTTARSAHRGEDGFTVGTTTGSSLTARRLLITTGLTDELPAIAGLRARWGRDVLHCPYCHGWGIRDEPIGVLGTNPMAVHAALLLRQWSDDVLLFRHTAPVRLRSSTSSSPRGASGSSTGRSPPWRSTASGSPPAVSSRGPPCWSDPAPSRAPRCSTPSASPRSSTPWAPAATSPPTSPGPPLPPGREGLATSPT
jgi:choline dehydrogenase-like flavoprotein